MEQELHPGKVLEKLRQFFGHQHELVGRLELVLVEQVHISPCRSDVRGCGGFLEESIPHILAKKSGIRGLVTFRRIFIQDFLIAGVELANQRASTRGIDKAFVLSLSKVHEGTHTQG